jgi:hypothetical protein
MREFDIMPSDTHSYFNKPISLPEMIYCEKELHNPKIPKTNKMYADRCVFGIEHENIVVKHLKASGYIIEDSQKLYRYEIPDTNFMLIGRIDGLRKYQTNKDPVLIEIKSRCGLFSGVRPHEYLQTMAYLLITGLKLAYIIESKGNNLRRFIIRRDDIYIQKLLGHIKDFINHIELTRKTHGEQ